MNIPKEDRLRSSKTKPKRRERNDGMRSENRPVFELNAAVIHLGAREMFVAASPGGDDLHSLLLCVFKPSLPRTVSLLVSAEVLANHRHSARDLIETCRS